MKFLSDIRSTAVALLGFGLLLSHPVAQATILPNGVLGDTQTSIIFDTTTGEVALDAPSNLTAIDIKSAASIFTGDAADNLGGLFDIDSDNRLFKVEPSGFGSLSFGNVAQAGLWESFMLNDLTVTGSLLGGGGLGNVDLIYLGLPAPGVLGDTQTSLIYDASTGEVAVDAPSNNDLAALDIQSTASVFTGDPADNLGGLFDIDSDSRLFKVDSSGFGSLSFGNVAQAGLSRQFVFGDLLVNGSLFGGGNVGIVDLIYRGTISVPESSTVVLLGLGLAGLGFASQRGGRRRV